MASVADFPSVLREGDVKALCVEFNIPKEMAWRVPDSTERAFTPPEGHITVYEAHLRSGLRLPLPAEFGQIMRALGVPIAQLHANAVRYICTLCIFARKLNQRLRMPGIRVLFKLNTGAEWISLSPRSGIKINTAIHDSLKHWKDRYFFVKVGEKWPLRNEWGEVPEAYFGTPTAEERAAYQWLLKAIAANESEFARDHLVSQEEIRKAEWGPPSPTHKPHPPVVRLHPEKSIGMIIREERAEDPERAMETPSSSSSHFDYIAAGACRGSGSTAGADPADAGVILAQPAVKVTPGAAWLGSAEEPARDVPPGSRVYKIRTSKAGSQMTTSKIIRGKRPAAAAASVPGPAASKAPAAAPAPVIPEAAREELATGEDSDAFIERVLEEAAASFAPESATRPPESGPRPTSRPKGPTRKLHEGKRLAYAVAHEVEQRDLLIAEKEAEIAWLEAELANAKGDRREEVAALEVVVASLGAQCSSLEEENTGLKESVGQLEASNKRLSDRATSFESELATRLRPHEIGGALQARLLEGIGIGRRVARLIDPNFPVKFINQRNSNATRKEDLADEPHDIR